MARRLQLGVRCSSPRTGTSPLSTCLEVYKLYPTDLSCFRLVWPMFRCFIPVIQTPLIRAARGEHAGSQRHRSRSVPRCKSLCNALPGLFHSSCEFPVLVTAFFRSQFALRLFVWGCPVPFFMLVSDTIGRVTAGQVVPGRILGMNVYVFVRFVTYKFAFLHPNGIVASLVRFVNMSAPSISCTSSHSDSGLSGTSTPSSEFVPSKLYLLSPHFVDGARLQAFSSKLEKGYGDKILLSIAHERPFNVKDVQASVVSLGEAIPDLCLVDKQWVKVPEGKMSTRAPASLLNLICPAGGSFYLVDGAPVPLGKVSSVDEFVNAHDKQVVLVGASSGIESISGLTFPHADHPRRSIEHLFFERPSRRLFRLFWHGERSFAHIRWGLYHTLPPRASPSVLSPIALTRAVWCPYARRLAYPVGCVGFGDARYDSLGDVASKAD